MFAATVCQVSRCRMLSRTMLRMTLPSSRRQSPLWLLGAELLRRFPAFTPSVGVGLSSPSSARWLLLFLLLLCSGLGGAAAAHRRGPASGEGCFTCFA